MAGSAGHILSPWENTDLTFGQIKEIIIKSLSGTLDNASEKLDGQNIMMTYKGGHVYVARTPKQLRNCGEESIRWDCIGEYMKTPESKEAYSTAAQDFQTLLCYIEEETLRDFFCDGKYWLNMELLTPLMENIIPYGKSQLRIHNVQTEEGIIERDFSHILEIIKRAEIIENTTFDVDRTNKVSFKVIDLEEIDSEVLSENFMDPSDTIKDFLSIELLVFIREEFKKLGFEDLELRMALVKRWAYSDKSTNIKSILSGKNEKLVKWVRETDSNIEDIKTEIIESIIELFSKVGAKVLQNLTDIASSDPQKSTEIIINKSKDAINKMKGYKGEKFKFLEVQYNRFLRAGGFDSIAPIEGIVFEYEGNLYKLTGSYLPLLKIISFFRFGRDVIIKNEKTISM